MGTRVSMDIRNYIVYIVNKLVYNLFRGQKNNRGDFFIHLHPVPAPDIPVGTLGIPFEQCSVHPGWLFDGGDYTTQLYGECLGLPPTH